MFKLVRPCANCPFRRGVGETFGLRRARLLDIFDAPAFQCHKTVDYGDDLEGEPGDKPQQCAGLMGLLAKIGRPNQIMQVGERLGYFDPDGLDLSDCYASEAEALAAHAGAK